MITLDTKVLPHSDVVHTTLEDDKAVLMHIGTTKYYSLNQTGSRIWALIQDGYTLHQICEQIVAEYDVTVEHAQASVLKIVMGLIDQGLLVIEDHPSATT